MEYKSINMYLSPLTSEVSQMKITDKCNEMASNGWKLVNSQVIDDCNIILIFKR